jgi:hypothetical protein
VQNLPAVVADGEAAAQNSEGQSRHGEEIHCSYCFAMVLGERTASAGLDQDYDSLA